MAYKMNDYLAMFQSYGQAKKNPGNGFAGDPGFSMANPNSFSGDPGFSKTPGMAGSGVKFTPGDWMGFANAYGGPAQSAGLPSVAGSSLTGNGGTAAGGSGNVMTNPGTTGATGGNGATQHDFSYKDLFGISGDMFNRLMTSMNTPMKFDPATDPSYLAAQTLARDGAKESSKAAMETMNDRGILNSSVTASQLKQIDQKAEMEPLKLIPQLQQQALNQRNTDQSMLYNLFSGSMNAGQNAYQFDQTMPLQRAAYTGTYTDPKVQGMVDTIMGAKRDYSGAPTKEAKDAIAKSAADARATLTGMGYDAEKLFGANVGLAQAGKNGKGLGSQMTASTQSALLGALTGAAQATGIWPKNTGGMFTDMPLFDGLAPVFKGMEGQETMDHKKFVVEMAKLGLQMQGEKISQAAQAQNRDYTAWLHANNISEAQGKVETNKYISDIAAKVGTKGSDGKPVDRTELFKQLAIDQPNLLRKGVLLQPIIDAINSASFEPNKFQDPKLVPQNPWQLP